MTPQIFCCVISFFYIKPQLTVLVLVRLNVVLYPSSTSNHNSCPVETFEVALCYILLLHQTTTLVGEVNKPRRCVISFFYIKPQLHNRLEFLVFGCVISFFYIKPQPRLLCLRVKYVVLYPSSTSNHNSRRR